MIESHAVGRPSSYTTERGESICLLIETHARGLRWLAEHFPDVVPTVTTIQRWLVAHDEFRARYARAKDVQADLLIEEALDILDNVEPFGMGSVPNAIVSKAREQATHRRWMAGRLAPKRWGDRMEHDVGSTAADTIAQLVKRASE